jgi:inorganic pyrophosphatase
MEHKTTLQHMRSTQHFAKNPWHFVPVGANAPDFVNAIIEIPADSKAKYELDKDSGLLKLDRVLFSSVHYPQNYGFIPQTYCEDNDPLDIMVICSISVEPLCLIEAKVIGVMRMIDQGEKDDKIIAVAKHDMSVSHYNNIEELPPHILEQIHRFFEDYKKMEKKEVVVEKFLGKEKAFEILNESIALYNKTFQGM